jgi:hypothetical protein
MVVRPEIRQNGALIEEHQKPVPLVHAHSPIDHPNGQLLLQLFALSNLIA